MRITADYPPVWLAGGVALAWLAGRILSLPSWPVTGAILCIAGFGIMAWAALFMLRHRTTVDPHGKPTALVTTGPFRWSRNPIYLGDALVLTGICVWCGAWPVAPFLIWGFARIITTRFILPEENYLKTGFPTQFSAFSARTRRWI
jgi:protein-S-isoprenylcysteine O-methyltransferase Ste14